MNALEHLTAAIKAVYARHSAGCCQHLVVDDCNTDDASIEHCNQAWEECGNADCLVVNRLIAMYPEDERDMMLALAKGDIT
jgi:hypothetical protein